MLRPSRRYSPQTRTDPDRANIALLTLVWLAVTSFGVLAIARAASVVYDRAQAQTLADAVALVAADRDPQRAREFAGHVNATVVSMTVHERVVTVTVSVGGTRASASAVMP